MYKIIVSILVLAAVFGTWYLTNGSSESPSTETTTNSSEQGIHLN